MLQDRKLILLVTGLVLLVFFESGQQYYYIVTFDLSNAAVDYWGILLGHAYRWVIWLILSAPFWYWLSQKAPKQPNLIAITAHLSVLLVMLNLNFLAMSMLQMWRFSDSFSFANLSELYTFYGFQKGPIYLIAYLLTYFYFFYERKTSEYDLLVKDHHDLQQLLELDSQRSTPTGMSVLTAKIGDSKHLIPVDQIKYIEADDYCVNIYTAAEKKFVLRASLKHLGQDLPESFLRVHRSYLVNFNYVTSLKLGDQRPHLLTTAGDAIPVAKSRYAQLNRSLSRSNGALGTIG